MNAINSIFFNLLYFFNFLLLQIAFSSAVLHVIRYSSEYSLVCVSEETESPGNKVVEDPVEDPVEDLDVFSITKPTAAFPS